ncbi:MAG: hypothetical protein ACKO3T_22085 [Planctomycetaceae bacterium]
MRCQQSAATFPAKAGEKDCDNFVEVFREELRKCDVVALPLEKRPGKIIKWNGEETYMAVMQVRLADEEGKPVELYRPAELTRDNFDEDLFATPELADQYRNLLFERAVNDWDEFQRAVIERVRSTVTPSPEGFIYFDFKSDETSPDWKLIREIIDFFEEQGIPCRRQQEDNPNLMDQFRMEVQSALACFVVYGDPKKKKWVNGRLESMSKYAWNQDKPRPVCLVTAPPPGKDVTDRQILLPGAGPWWREVLQILDFQKGFRREQFCQLLSRSGISCN